MIFEPRRRGRLLAVRVVVVAGLAVGFATPASALEVVAAVRGTAVDAEYDGVFEDLNDATIGGEFATVTMGRVLGMFESERRAILEFSIASIPQGTAIGSGRLLMDFVSGSNERGAYFFYGYQGDGLLSFGDSDRTEDLVTSQSGAGFSVDIDVTDFVQELIDAGADWVGILGLEVVDGVNTNFIAGPLEGRMMPTLVIDLPEAGAASATAAALATVGLLGRRGRG